MLGLVMYLSKNGSLRSFRREAENDDHFQGKKQINQRFLTSNKVIKVEK